MVLIEPILSLLWRPMLPLFPFGFGRAFAPLLALLLVHCREGRGLLADAVRAEVRRRLAVATREEALARTALAEAVEREARAALEAELLALQRRLIGRLGV